MRAENEYPKPAWAIVVAFTPETDFQPLSNLDTSESLMRTGSQHPGAHRLDFSTDTPLSYK